VLSGPTENSKTLRGRIISGSVVLLSGSSLATAINLAYNVAVARFLGPKGFGNATAVYTLLTMTSAVTLAFQIVSTKVVAQQQSEQGRDAAYRDLHRIAWGCGALVALLLIVFQRGIAGYLNLPSSTLVVFLAVAAAFYVPLGTRRGYIQGAFGFRSLATNLVIEGAVRLLGSLMMIGLGFGVTGVIAANAAAIAVAYFAIAPKLAERVPNALTVSYAFREISQAAIFYSGQVLINNCDIVLVKHFFAPEAAGLYAAVAMVGRVTFAFSSAVVNSMFPVVASTHHAQRKNLSLIATSLLLVLAVGSVFSLALRIAPAGLWTLFFGPSFVLAGPHGFPYLLALYAITTVVYSLSVVVITYEMSYKIANTSWVQLVVSGVVIASICRFHDSLRQVILVQLILMAVLLLAVAVPFLIDTLKSEPVVYTSPSNGLRLIRRVTEDEVIAEFMKSELENAAYGKYRESVREIVSEPDLENRDENAKRRALLFLRHRSLWKELPLNTEWHEAEIEESDLERIRVFPRAHWRKLARGNFAITQVAQEIRSSEPANADSFAVKISDIRRELKDQDSKPGSVVLIGINEREPFTIIDGNHRFVSAVLEGRIDRLRVYCGLSPEMARCCWYRTSLYNLTRYGRHLVQYGFRLPEAELKSVLGRRG
jgi:O-antigen/teichoic acid export membrane protein